MAAKSGQFTADETKKAAPTFHHLNLVVWSTPLYSRGGPKWWDNYPEGPDHVVVPNRLETSLCRFDGRELRWMHVALRARDWEFKYWPATSYNRVASG